MPIGVCQTCGSTVKFEGSAGLCPNCGTVLRAGQRAARTTPAGPAASPKSKPKAPRAKSEPVDLDSLEIGEEQEFAPGESGAGKPPTDPVIFYLSVGAGAVLVVFGLFFALQTLLSRPGAPVIAPPPAIARATPAPPPPLEEPAPVDQPAPVAVVPTAVPHPPPTTGPTWMNLKPALPKLDAFALTDKTVGNSIIKAVNYLKSMFGDDALISLRLTNAQSVGMNALAIYALMHAGEAINDPDLLVSSEFMQRVLNRLKQFDMSTDISIYQRSLRSSALAMFNRTVDQEQLGKDRDWLLKAAPNGAYDYTPIPPKTPADAGGWDNSNSQYGLLGVWAAAQAGVSVPDKYWVDVEQHWLSCQDTDGGWPYALNNRTSSTSMTAAGVTSLCVTAEQQELIASKGKHDARPHLSRAIARGVDWLGDSNHLQDQGASNRGYRLYGIERAALATGYRFFGDHDWYRELGSREIKEQNEDGSWSMGDGSEGTTVETSFHILFLSRGRQPLLMNKLRFAGDWNDRPRDVAKLAQFVSGQLEKPFAWGVADLSRNWQDWMESPILFITTDAPPDFSDEECAKLRAYTDAGGFIFVHNEFGSPEVDAFVASLVKRVYPEYPMKRVAANDLLYSAVYPIKKPLLLGAVGNGVRTLLVYSPKDITQEWVRYRPKDSARDNSSLQLGVNLTVVASGKSDYRNRLDSPYEEVPQFEPIGTLPVFQISYPGMWNPEPKAYERFSRWFEKQTSLKLNVEPTPVTGVDWQKGPIAVMTGTSPIDTKKMDFHPLHDFVSRGGVLFIDAAGGNAAFTQSVMDDFLPQAFPGAVLAPMLAFHPIFSAGQPCMDALPKPRLRNYAQSLLNGAPPELQFATVGKGTVIFCPLDVSAGLLSSSTYAINGYTPAYCQSLMKNVILWALGRYHFQS